MNLTAFERAAARLPRLTIAVPDRIASAWPAFVGAFLALCWPIQIADALVVVTFFGTVWLLEREQPPGLRLLPVFAGVFAGFAVLVKVNNGLVVLALLALAAWRLRPGRL